MGPLKVAIQLASLRLPLKQAMLRAAELGAVAVEIDARSPSVPRDPSPTAIRDLRRQLDDLNLRVSCVGFHTRRGYDVLEDLDRRVTAAKAAMKLAYALGARVVVNQLGRIPAEPEGPSWNLLLQVLGDLGQYGMHIGALLAARTGTESGATLAPLLAAVPEASIGVDLDPGNLIIHDFSPSEMVAAVGPSIIHVHARDGVRDFSRGRGTEVPLGRGSADFPALLGALEERGYRGYLTLSREHADDPVLELGDAVKYLRSL